MLKIFNVLLNVSTLHFALFNFQFSNFQFSPLHQRLAKNPDQLLDRVIDLLLRGIS